MKGLSRYDIKIINLEDNKKFYDFHIEDSFFAINPESEVKKGNLKARITIKPMKNKIEIIFQIKGTIELICDNSLKLFQHPILTKKLVIFEFGYKNKEITLDHYMIDKQTYSINIWQHLYDFIIFEVPIKKIHPEILNFSVDGIVLYTTKH